MDFPFKDDTVDVLASKEQYSSDAVTDLKEQNAAPMHFDGRSFKCALCASQNGQQVEEWNTRRAIEDHLKNFHKVSKNVRKIMDKFIISNENFDELETSLERCHPENPTGDEMTR